MENSPGAKAAATSATLTQARYQALESTTGTTGAPTKGNGKTIKCTDEGSSYGLMVESILGSIFRIRNMAMGLLYGLVVKSI